MGARRRRRETEVRFPRSLARLATEDRLTSFVLAAY